MRSSVKLLLLASCFLVLNFLLFLKIARGEEQPGVAEVVVAKINGEEVYLGELLSRLREKGPPRADPHSVQPDPIPNTPPKTMDRKALIDQSLEEIIRFRLLMQEAKAEKISLLSEDDFRKAFPASAMTLPNLSSVAFQVDWAARELKRRLVEHLMSRVSATPKELEKLFEEERYGLQPEVAQIHWIAVENRGMAQALLARLKAGEEFATIAQEASIEKVSASSGGLVGTVVPAKIHEEVSKVVFAPDAKPGLVPEPIEVTSPVPFYGPPGWYIIYIDKIIRQGEGSLDAWRPIIEAQVKKEKAEKLLNDRLTQRRAKAKIWISKDLYALVEGK